MGRKENKWWDSSVFSQGPPKSFLSKIERKLREESSWKASKVTHGIHLQVYNVWAYFHFFWFWFFLSVTNVCWLPLHLFFLFFFSFSGTVVPTCWFFLLLLLFFLSVTNVCWLPLFFFFLIFVLFFFLL